MPSIYAYCRKCPAWVPTSIKIEGSGSLSFSGAGQICPKCGSRAEIIDGVYSVVDGVVDVIQAPGFTADELKRLTKIFQDATKAQTPVSDLQEIINREVPAASGLNKLIGENPALVFLITTILAAWASITPFLAPNDSKTNTDKIIEAIMQLKPKEAAPTKTHKPKPVSKGRKHSRHKFKKIPK